MTKMAAEPHLTDLAQQSARSTARPVVACYCATFLKPEMLHIYRQIVSLTRFSPVVKSRKNAKKLTRFPFSKNHGDWQADAAFREKILVQASPRGALADFPG